MGSEAGEGISMNACADCSERKADARCRVFELCLCFRCFAIRMGLRVLKGGRAA